MTKTFVPHEARERTCLVSDDPALLEFDVVHAYLARSYWSPGIPAETLRRAMEHSMCFGAYDVSDGARTQIGFARVVTDRATYAYLADVFVLEGHRGRGVSKLIMRAVTTHPELQGLRRWMLMTRDAHGLYEQFGFSPLRRPNTAMELWRPDVYGRQPDS